MKTSLNKQEFIREISEITDIQILNKSSDRQRLSKDFFDYSPILEEKLKDCCADIVVRPFTVDSIIAIASACRRHGIPLTLRGSGTGNYGQCVPLQAGLVMLMGGLNEICEFNPETGHITVEPGCLLRDLDRMLLSKGRQLRLVPSTWRSASIGGFIAGGSGGIGSVRWGFLRDQGHLLGMEVITLENPPRKLKLNANDSEPLNHAYGTNGIITSLTIATTSAVSWQEVIIDCEDFSAAVELLLSITQAAVELYLATLLEKDIVANLPAYRGMSHESHKLLILVAPDGVETLKNLSIRKKAKLTHLGAEDLTVGTGLRELTWNHTTLHMRSADSQWTYLQMLLPKPEIKVINLLKRKWGNDLLWHIEGVRQYGEQRLAALPVIRWRGKNVLEEMISDCKNNEAILFNPHVITVEDGGLGVVDTNQVKAKANYDPEGILNPGKLRGWM